MMKTLELYTFYKWLVVLVVLLNDVRCIFYAVRVSAIIVPPVVALKAIIPNVD